MLWKYASTLVDEAVQIKSNHLNEKSVCCYCFAAESLFFRNPQESRKFSDTYEEHRTILNDVVNVEEMLAYFWCLNHLELIDLKDKNDCLFVTYEALLTQYESEFNRIFEFLGEQVPRGLDIDLQRASASTIKSTIDVNEQLHGWKKVLSEKQIDSISKTLAKFGLGDYHSVIETISRKS